MEIPFRKTCRAEAQAQKNPLYSGSLTAWRQLHRCTSLRSRSHQLGFGDFAGDSIPN